MLYSKIKLRPDERAIIIIDQKLHSIRAAGEHRIWHGTKSFNKQINNMKNLAVEWDGVQAALRFQRPIAEQCWHIVDSADDSITIVWHKYLTPQIVPNGESRAFWQPEHGKIEQITLKKQDYWLPENVQAALLYANDLDDNLHRISVKPHEKLIICVNGELDKILDMGDYVLHLPSDGSVQIMQLNNTADSLIVTVPNIDHILRFQRETAQQYWTIIDSPIGHDTLVWHEQQLAPQIVPSGESRAFWQPEQGHLHTCVLAQHDFRLPENVETQLLQQGKLSKPLMRYTVKAHEKMLITLRGQLQRVCDEGEYIVRIPDDNVKVLFADCQIPEFMDIKTVQMWAKQQPELIHQHFDLVEVSADELLLYSVGGTLAGWVAPNTCAYFWRHAATPYSIQRIDLTKGLQISADIIARLKAAHWTENNFKQIVHMLEVPTQHQGLVYVNQSLQAVLAAGQYFYWQLNQKVHSEIIDLRQQTCEISGQELLTEDKVTVRVNAVCNYRVIDAPLWLAQHRRPDEYLYREFQFAIRAVIGGKSMDNLLSDKQKIDEELSAVMREKRLQGIELDNAGMKDIILPGEIRTILTKVVEAEKSAQANNIRRREETAATRSLLNTARVMEENPTALRLKELETLEKVTEKIDKISVYGGLDGVLNGLINIGNAK